MKWTSPRAAMVLACFLVWAMSGCGDPEDEREPSQTWEEACLRWKRADCTKFLTCFDEPAEGCGRSDAELISECKAKAMEQNCANPDLASFDGCAKTIERQTCEEYCDDEFCFSFCFYSCG